MTCTSTGTSFLVATATVTGTSPPPPLRPPFLPPPPPPPLDSEPFEAETPEFEQPARKTPSEITLNARNDESLTARPGMLTNAGIGRSISEMACGRGTPLPLIQKHSKFLELSK